MITMDDIIREGHPTLRQVARAVSLPLTKEELTLGEEMLTFLKNSQNPDIAEKYELRGGVGLAAPQLDISKRIVAVHVPSMTEDSTEPSFSDVLINPKIISHSIQEACMKEGEGCLSVDRDVPGYVVRYSRITLTYTDLAGHLKKKKFKNYEAIVVQHEIDHLNGIMFFDHINEANPYAAAQDVLLIE